MSKHPLNGMIRLLLEIAALVTFGYWGLNLSTEGYRYFLMLAIPLLFALLWGVFAVRDDPSRSGKTVVPTPGPIRLILELALFGATSWMLLGRSHRTLAIAFAAVVVLHYLVSWDRIAWLLKQR